MTNEEADQLIKDREALRKALERSEARRKEITESQKCCDEFSDYARDYNALDGIWFDGTEWVAGTCGDHVLSGMKFCPFCGAKLIVR